MTVAHRLLVTVVAAALCWVVWLIVTAPDRSLLDLRITTGTTSTPVIYQGDTDD